MIRFITSPLSSRTIGQNPLALRQFVLPIVLALLVVMLFVQTIQGERGFLALFELDRQWQKKQHELTQIKLENQRLLSNIQLLSGDQPDLDFLDERARAVLGYAQKGDQVLILR
ncbi:MAG: FtsB family cell division protein [Parvibaculales bacterium]